MLCAIEVRDWVLVHRDGYLVDMFDSMESAILALDPFQAV